MSSDIDVSVAAFSSASPRDVESGLLGWLTLLVDRVVVVDSVALRRTLRGELRLSFPGRQVGNGRRPYVRPVDDAARREIERQVLAAIDRDGSAEAILASEKAARVARSGR